MKSKVTGGMHKIVLILIWSGLLVLMSACQTQTKQSNIAEVEIKTEDIDNIAKELTEAINGLNGKKLTWIIYSSELDWESDKLAELSSEIGVRLTEKINDLVKEGKHKEVYQFFNDCGTISKSIYIRDKIAELESVHAEALEKMAAEDPDRVDFGQWEIINYIDEFGDSTGEKAITNKEFIKGQFSNSATTDSDLNARIYFDADDTVSLRLYEYGDHKVNSLGNNKGYTIIIKADGQKTEGKADKYLRVDRSLGSHIIQVLRKNLAVEVYMYDLDYYSTSYRFNIEADKLFDPAYKVLSLSNK